jgi:hypothetical protein
MLTYNYHKEDIYCKHQYAAVQYELQLISWSADMTDKDDAKLAVNNSTQKVIDALKVYETALGSLRLKYDGELDEQQQNEFFVLSCMLLLNRKYINLLLTLKNGHNYDDNGADQFIDDKNRNFSQSLLSKLKLDEINLEGDNIFDIWSVISKNLAGEDGANNSSIAEMSNRNVSIANKDLLAAAVIVSLGFLSAGVLTFVVSSNIVLALVIPITLGAGILATLPGVYSEMRYRFANRLSRALSISGEEITLPVTDICNTDPSKRVNIVDVPMGDMSAKFFHSNNGASSLEAKFNEEIKTMSV